MPHARRCDFMQTFAIIPAAGRSRRMGRPKLLLPWGDATVIEHVLATWRASSVDRVVVVVDPRDEPLARLCAQCGVQVVVPEVPPAEMKDSVLLGLAWAETQNPAGDDAFLVAPADMPGLAGGVIDRLIDAHVRSVSEGGGPTIRVPRYGAKRGHPVLFPWPLAAEVARLGADEGLNVLLERHGVEDVDVAAAEIAGDFDTPDDYDRLRRDADK
jgi:molybdenum cofactor cytidylyltransferase